jgi:excisionase family DNA binding protein
MVVQGTPETDLDGAGRRPRVQDRIQVVRSVGLLSVRQVAEALGVCTAVVYKLVERGELRHVRVSNAIRVAPGDLADYAARTPCSR